MERNKTRTSTHIPSAPRQRARGRRPAIAGLVTLATLLSAAYAGTAHATLLSSWQFSPADVSGSNVAASGGTAGLGDSRYTGSLQANAIVTGDALFLDGSGDFLQFGNNLTEIRTMSSYAISTWVFNTSPGNDMRRIVEHEDNTYFWSEAGIFQYTTHGTPGGTAGRAQSTTSPAVGDWQHVLVTATGGGAANIYIDGVLEGTSTVAQAAIPNNAHTFQIGARRSASGAATNFWSGLIDDVAIFDGKLSVSQINALAAGGDYNNRITPTALAAASFGPDLMLHLTMDDADIAAPPGTTVADISGNGRDGTMMNGQTRSGDAGQIQQALDFAGGLNNTNSEYVDLSPHVADFAGMNQGTIAAWIQTNPSDVDTRVILAASDQGDASSEVRLFLFEPGGSAVARFDGRNDGTSIGILEGTTNLEDGELHHVAVTVDEFGNGMLWVDGNVESTGNVGFFSSVIGLDTLGVGRNKDSTAGGGQWFFDGLIDDLAVFDKALSPEQIDAIYTGGLQGLNVQEALNPAGVPEPSTALLCLLTGAMALGRGRRRRAC